METAVFTSAAGATTASADFTYGDLSVRVSATRPDALQWLDEFLSPSFDVAPSAEYAATVTLHEDNRRYNEIAAAWHADQAVELDCFVNDSHVVRFPAVVSSSKQVTAFQASVPAFYRADPATRSFAIISGEGRTGARTALMRVVRELAMNHALLRGDIFLHAAALANAGSVMLIGGEKRAGKTTLLLYLLRHGRADYVSNDRVLFAARATPRLRAMPTIVSLRAETLPLLPSLAADFASAGYLHHRTVAEAAAQKGPRTRSDGSYSLSPAQLCAALGVGSVASGMPRVMLFPRITGEANVGSLHDLAPVEALASLRRAVLSAGMAKKTSDLVALPGDPPAPPAEQLDATLCEFAATVRCVECRLGTRSYENGTLAAQCFALLGDRI